jgi:hypothetical protein
MKLRLQDIRMRIRIIDADIDRRGATDTATNVDIATDTAIRYNYKIRLDTAHN